MSFQLFRTSFAGFSSIQSSFPFALFGSLLSQNLNEIQSNSVSELLMHVLTHSIQINMLLKTNAKINSDCLSVSSLTLDSVLNYPPIS